MMSHCIKQIRDRRLNLTVMKPSKIYIYIYLGSVDSSLCVFVILDATIHIQNRARPYTPARASRVESI